MRCKLVAKFLSYETYKVQIKANTALGIRKHAGVRQWLDSNPFEY